MSSPLRWKVRANKCHRQLAFEKEKKTNNLFIYSGKFGFFGGFEYAREGTAEIKKGSECIKSYTPVRHNVIIDFFVAYLKHLLHVMAVQARH